MFPVNHCVIDGTVAFRVADGSKLGAAIQSAVVAFEVDRYGASRRDGWSVVVKGRVEVAADGSTLRGCGPPVYGPGPLRYHGRTGLWFEPTRSPGGPGQVWTMAS